LPKSLKSNFRNSVDTSKSGELNYHKNWETWATWKK